MKLEYIQDLVSVIIPTYNQEQTLLETLNSVFSQTYRPIELIVIDDGSSDNTKMIVNDFIRKHEEINNFKIYYFFQENRGASSARNKGLLESHGEFIQFLDSDDLLDEDKIHHQIIQAKHNINSIICGNWMYFQTINGDKVISHSNKIMDMSKDIITQWIEGIFFPPHSLLWPRKIVIENGPWDESLTREQDGDYFIRAVLNDYSFKMVSSAASYYRVYSKPNSSISTTSSVSAVSSRIRVISKLRYALIRKGKFSIYQQKIAEYYKNIAITYAFIDNEIIEQCFEEYKNLSPKWSEKNLYYHFLAKSMRLVPNDSYYDRKLRFDAKKRFKNIINQFREKTFIKCFFNLIALIFIHPIWIFKIIIENISKQRVKADNEISN